MDLFEDDSGNTLLPSRIPLRFISVWVGLEEGAIKYRGRSRVTDWCPWCQKRQIPSSGSGHTWALHDFDITEHIVLIKLPGDLTVCCTGNGAKLSSSQAEPGQVFKSGVA